jgi:hypothetical protein
MKTTGGLERKEGGHVAEFQMRTLRMDLTR